MIYFSIQENIPAEIDEELLRTTVIHVLSGLNQAENNELTIAIEDDEQLQELNKQFLNIDAPTDVLSFPGGEIDPETGNPYLGDIILSYTRANLQAQSSGHSLHAEIQLLIIHGVLHLLGYDHADPEEKEEMWGLQRRFLQEMGISINKLPED